MSRPIKFRDISAGYINANYITAQTQLEFSDNSIQDTASCVSYSFFLDVAGNSYGAATVGLRGSFYLDITNTIKGWPILPHAVGSYFNTFGTFINGLPINWSNKPVSYGHFQASKGQITHMHINYDFTSWEGFPINIKAINYTNGSISTNSNDIIVITNLVDADLVSSKYIKLESPIDVNAGEHIGIFIEDTGNGPLTGSRDNGCIVEGSILVKLKA